MGQKKEKINKVLRNINHIFSINKILTLEKVIFIKKFFQKARDSFSSYPERKVSALNLHFRFNYMLYKKQFFLKSDLVNDGILQFFIKNISDNPKTASRIYNDFKQGLGERYFIESYDYFYRHILDKFKLLGPSDLLNLMNISGELPNAWIFKKKQIVKTFIKKITKMCFDGEIAQDELYKLSEFNFIWEMDCQGLFEECVTKYTNYFIKKILIPHLETQKDLCYYRKK